MTTPALHETLEVGKTNAKRNAQLAADGRLPDAFVRWCKNYYGARFDPTECPYSPEDIGINVEAKP